MNQVWAGVVGAASVVLVAAIVYGGYRAWRWVAGFANVCLRAVRAIEQTAQELAYMRGMTQMTQAEQQAGEAANYTTETNQSLRGQQEAPASFNAFPTQVYDRFKMEPPPPPPDAKVEDTDVDLLNQTDEDLTALERLERMRQDGMEVEDSDAKHDAVIVESK